MNAHTNQPAMIHDHVDLDALACEIKATIIEAGQHSGKAVELYALAGEKLLKVKSAVGHGNWLPWVAKNLPQKARQATNLMRLAMVYREASAEEQWRLILGRDDISPQVDDAQTVSGETQPNRQRAADLTENGSQPEAGQEDTDENESPKKGSPYPLEKRCKDCRLYQLDKPRCAKCREKNTPAREPGDDTGNVGKKPSTNGRTLFDMKTFETPFGALMRAIDHFGKAYHCKETPATQGLRRKLGEVLAEFKKLAKEVRK